MVAAAVAMWQMPRLAHSVRIYGVARSCQLHRAERHCEMPASALHSCRLQSKKSTNRVLRWLCIAASSTKQPDVVTVANVAPAETWHLIQPRS